MSAKRLAEILPMPRVNGHKPERKSRAPYRQVQLSWWRRPEIRTLTPETKLVLLNLVTGSTSHMTGLVILQLATVARETSLTVAQVEAALQAIDRLTPVLLRALRDCS